MTKEHWKDVGAIDDIPAQGARTVETGVGRIAVFRTLSGDLFAIEDKCPHLGGPLSQGIVHGTAVTCPLHNLVIDLASGGVVGPDDGCVLTLPVRIDGDRILLDLTKFFAKAA